MTRLSLLLIAAALICGCDNTRVYEKNFDFTDRTWIVTNKPTFEFNIEDPKQQYNIYCNVRSSLAFPFARFFVKYSLTDSLKTYERKDLVSTDIFDRSTGEPFGSSGLGDIYDHQFLITKKYTFPHEGKHWITFEQFNRRDTLEGVLAVGVRVERVSEND
jgi:gliding motility-associated lipoprotein GldH